MRNELDRLRRAGSPWGHSEPWAVQNQFTELRKSNPLDGVAFKNATENKDHLIGQGQNGLEEEGILEISPERGVLGRGTFPRVAPARQVDQDDTQAPDVIRGGSIARERTGVRLLTFWPRQSARAENRVAR